jgi:hypothetical protein
MLSTPSLFLGNVLVRVRVEPSIEIGLTIERAGARADIARAFAA